MGDPLDRISALIARDTRELAPFLFLPCEDTARKGVLGLEPIHTGTLISDFQPPELRENKFLFIYATQSMVFCSGSPSGLRQVIFSSA